MGQFNAKGLTAKGQALQAKAQAGAQLNYTKFMIGDGNLGGSPIGPLTALISPKLTLPITGKEMTPPDRATLMTVVDNQGVTTGFYWREVGIFAQDPDEGEILYWYGNAGAMADYIPAGGGSDIFQELFAVHVFVGEATNVTAVIDSSLVYATQDDLTAAKEEMKDYTDAAVAGVTIPSASLTQQGKVQLNNAIDSINQTMAATPKAVNDARQAAISAAATDATTKANTAEANAKNASIPKMIPDTRNVPTKPSDYRTNVAYNFKIGSVVGLPNEGFVVIHGFKGYHDDSGGVTHEYASGGDTGAMYHRTGTSANDTWGPWSQIVDSGWSWQKVAVTSDSGFALNISNANLNDPRNTGWYMGFQVVNAPSSDWHYFEIIRHNDLWEVQNAYNFNRMSFYQRLKQNGVWTPWSADVFQSGVDAKNGIVGAINAKGGSASTNDTWAQLADKIRLLSMFKAGDYALKSLDSGGATDTTYPSMGSYFKPSVGGTFRVSFTLFASHDITGSSAYGQIYVNGVPRGPQRTVNNNTGGQRFTEDVTINTGDAIQLYLWASNSQTIASASFFTLSSDFNIVTGS